MLLAFPVLTQIFCTCICVSVFYLAARPRVVIKMTLMLMNFGWSHMWTTGGDLFAELDWFVLDKLSSGLQSQHSFWQPAIPSRESTVKFVSEQLQAGVVPLNSTQPVGGDPLLHAAVVGATMAMSQVENAAGASLGSSQASFVDGPYAGARAHAEPGLGLMVVACMLVGTVKIGKGLGI